MQALKKEPLGSFPFAVFYAFFSGYHSARMLSTGGLREYGATGNTVASVTVNSAMPSMQSNDNDRKYV